jgi:hypothetical protein
MAHPAASNLICSPRQDQISRSPPLPFSHSQDRGIDSVGLFQSRKVCQVLCPPCKHLGTFAHSQPHATITSKLFCFSSIVENRRVVLDGPPALGAGGLRFKSGRPDQYSLRLAGISKKSFPSLWGKFRGPYCNIPIFSASCCSSCIFTTASCIFAARYVSSLTPASTL